MSETPLFCTVHYVYSNDAYSDKQKKKYEEDFMKLRSEAVGMLNPNYERWNSEYGKEVHGEDDFEYNGFISDKQRMYLTIINERHNNSSVELDSDEYADIIARIKGTDDVIHLNIHLIDYNTMKKMYKNYIK